MATRPVNIRLQRYTPTVASSNSMVHAANPTNIITGIVISSSHHLPQQKWVCCQPSGSVSGTPFLIVQQSRLKYSPLAQLSSRILQQDAKESLYKMTPMKRGPTTPTTMEEPCKMPGTPAIARVPNMMLPRAPRMRPRQPQLTPNSTAKDSVAQTVFAPPPVVTVGQCLSSPQPLPERGDSPFCQADNAADPSNAADDENY